MIIWGMQLNGLADKWRSPFFMCKNSSFYSVGKLISTVSCHHGNTFTYSSDGKTRYNP